MALSILAYISVCILEHRRVRTHDWAIKPPSLLTACEPSQSARTVVKRPSRSLRNTAIESRGPSCLSAKGDLCQLSQSFNDRVIGTRNGLPRARHMLLSSDGPCLRVAERLTLFPARTMRSNIFLALSTTIRPSRIRDPRRGIRPSPVPSSGQDTLLLLP